MWVGILENKNVRYKSICMPGKVSDGLLNELFQVYVYSPVFPMTFLRYRLLPFLFHSLEVHFTNSYNYDKMFVGPLSIKRNISLLCSQNIENIELSPSCLYLFLSVLFIGLFHFLAVQGDGRKKFKSIFALDFFDMNILSPGKQLGEFSVSLEFHSE